MQKGEHVFEKFAVVYFRLLSRVFALFMSIHTIKRTFDVSLMKTEVFCHIEHQKGGFSFDFHLSFPSKPDLVLACGLLLLYLSRRSEIKICFG